MLRHLKGFTLVELLVVVAIVGIIAMVAIPAYNNSVNKSRRADGKAALMSLQLAMEKYRGSCSTYATTINSAITADDCTNSRVAHATASNDGHYNLTISTGGQANNFVITATAATGSPQVDDAQGGTACTPLTITVNGTNPKGLRTPAVCW